MLVIITLWVGCAIAYWLFGNLIAYLSLRTIRKQLKTATRKTTYVETGTGGPELHEHFAIDNPDFLSWLFFPVSSYRRKFDVLYGRILRPSAKGYKIAVALLWPVKLAWCITILLLLAFGKTIIFPLRLISKLTPDKKLTPAVKPADKLDDLRLELIQTESQKEKLQISCDEIAKEIMRLESEQAAEEGMTVYRADRSADSKWRLSSS